MSSPNNYRKTSIDGPYSQSPDGSENGYIAPTRKLDDNNSPPSITNILEKKKKMNDNNTWVDKTEGQTPTFPDQTQGRNFSQFVKSKRLSIPIVNIKDQ